MTKLERRLQASRKKAEQQRGAGFRLLIRMGIVGGLGCLFGAGCSPLFVHGAGVRAYWSIGIIVGVLSAYVVRHLSEERIEAFRKRHDV